MLVEGPLNLLAGFRMLGVQALGNVCACPDRCPTSLRRQVADSPDREAARSLTTVGGVALV
jgi:hypothetical protein